MIRLRSLISGTLRARTLLSQVQTPLSVQKFGCHWGPPQPFDNLPFRVINRYVATVFFCFFFGVGLWAPFLIVWYSMAKRSL
ncbi:hypothetical protein PYW08_000057 [Mythimna loreyi]|uniref:Uncharacterized protein n=1 Tax=Mythimna loreyi TaxID=667449 RepID=A0ACC2RBH8_9NEOP|nr:hypothetical protein PYW08_000057 [Mythimna loreyi]